LASNSVEVTGPGGFGARLGGPLVIVSTFFLVILGGLGYLHLENTKVNTHEHQALRRSQDLTTCAVMIPPDWRDIARRTITKKSEFANYCPWLNND